MPDHPSLTTRADGFTLHLQGTAAPGATIGIHWHDPVSGRFLRESPWVEAASTGTFSTSIAIPPAPGAYRFHIVEKSSSTDWSHKSGKPFWNVDTLVTADGLTIARTHRTSLAALERERIPGTLREVFLGPWLAILNHRHLIQSMVRRDIFARYRGSFADRFWAFLNPLLLMLTYYFVFGVVLRARFPGDPTQFGYVLYFLSGMLPWLAMSESIARSPNSTLENRNLITKLIFPVEVLPINLTLAGLSTGLTATAIFLAFLVFTRGGLPLTATLLPLLWLPQFLFTAGLCYFFAAIGAYVRDLVFVIGLLLNMWFYLTPICYPDTNLPELLVPVLGKNPVYIFVRAYRAILIEGHPPEWIALAKLTALSLLIFYSGYAFFRRARRGFTDVL